MAALAGPTLGIAAALVCALAWTVLALVARTLSGQFPPFSLNIIRSGVGGLFLLPVALFAGGLGDVTRVSATAWIYLMASVALAVGIGDTAFFQSTRVLGLARAMTISTSYPLMASVLALAIFGERITPAVAAGSVVTLAGLVLIVGERDSAAVTEAEGRQQGIALALGAAVCWAISAVLMKPPLREIDPVTIQGARLPLVALLLWATPWARGTARRLWALRRSAGPSILALGALTALSAVCYMAGLKYAGVTLGTVLSSTSPLFALPIGLLARDERITWRAAAGALLSVVGIVILSL
jgi:drug/metabolite transporter (DMT)-like permease